MMNVSFFSKLYLGCIIGVVVDAVNPKAADVVCSMPRACAVRVLPCAA